MTSRFPVVPGLMARSPDGPKFPARTPSQKGTGFLVRRRVRIVQWRRTLGLKPLGDRRVVKGTSDCTDPITYSWNLCNPVVITFLLSASSRAVFSRLLFRPSPLLTAIQ